jgi:hypothetical protein
MSGQPALVLPIRMDPGDALKTLDRVSAAGKKAGADVQHGADDAGKGLRGAASEATQVASAIGSITVAGVGLGTVRSVVGVMVDQMKQVSDHAERLAKNFIAVQKQFQGIAQLAGTKNTNAFTLQEAQTAASANLTPDQWAQFRDSFLSTASNYVQGPNAKMSAADAEEYQKSLAEYAMQHKVASGEMAAFGGGLLGQLEGPTTAAEMKARAGKVFATLEASSAPVARLLPNMTRVMAQGVSAEDAAVSLAGMPEIAPQEEGTHLLRVMAEVRRLNLEGKGATFGIDKAMNPQQQLEALVGNLHRRAAGGEDLDKMLRDVTHEDIAANTLRGLARRGPAGFAQWRGILDRTSPAAIDEGIAEGRQTEPGRVMHAEAQQALADVVQGERKSPLEIAKMEASAQLTMENRFDEFHPSDIMRAPLSMFGTKVNQQLINERALRNAYDAGGVSQGNRPGLAPGATQFVADRAILDQLVKNNELLERQVKAQEAAANNRRPAPLICPPPATGPGVGRM